MTDLNMRVTVMKLAPILSCLVLCPFLLAQTKIPASDWPMYARDLNATRY